MKRSGPLQRKTPLQRGKPLRKVSLKKEAAMKNADQRTKAIHDKSAYKFRRKQALPKESKKMQKARREYYPLNNAFLKRLENRWCAVCACRSANLTVTELRTVLAMHWEEADRPLRLAGATLTQATEVHHSRGRIGRLLNFEPFFLPSCRGCREWPHTFFKRARELELLAPSTLYNTFPSEEEIAALGGSRKPIFEKTKIAA